MAQYINNLAPTTEVEALNSMLSVIGEAPFTDVDSAVASGDTRIVGAVNILRLSAKAVQVLRWRFNTEFGYELSPIAQLSWPDTSGATTSLNVFVPPAGMVSFDTTLRLDQQGSKIVDAVIRRSKYYLSGSPPVTQLVFYDRNKNREGWDVNERSKLYINPVWLFNYEDLPEEARWHIYVKAARQFQQQQVGSSELAQFSLQDEAFSLRQLKRAHGQPDKYNIFNNSSVWAAFGQRPVNVGIIDDLRGTPGHS